MDAFTAVTPSLDATARLTVAEATRAGRGALQACLDGCPDYFARTEGAGADPEAADHLLDEAEADPLRRLYLFSLRRGGAAAALLDVWLHQPEPGTAHLGLLLVREALQGQGLGREAVAALEAALAAAGYRALRLSVTDENREVEGFWARLGFATVGRLEHGVTVYEKPLPG
jgi:ribosomal protein S18 acetylase RimI-like enzyme